MSAEDLGRVYVVIVELDIDRCLNTYGVSPCAASGAPGTECYNTFTTCQDKANYLRGTHTYRLVNRGAPLPRGVAFVRPYISKIDIAPTSAEPTQGLATRAKLSIDLADEPDLDTEQDPYKRNRAEEARATFWRLFLARTSGFAGRAARVRRGWIVPGKLAEPDYCSGDYFAESPQAYYDLTDDALIEELYTIDSLSPSDNGGRVKLVLKDPIKLGDRVKIPKPTAGKLATGINATALTFTLTDDHPEEYDAYGYPCDVLVEKEIIRVTSRAGNVFTIASLAQRGTHNTIAATHNTDTSVQLCRSWVNTNPRDILIDMLNEIGIDSANIDVDGFTQERDDWFGTGFDLSPVLVKPEDGTKRIQQLVQLLNGLMWWSNLDQQVKLKINAPPKHAESVSNFTDTANIIEDSVKVTNLDADRITRMAVYYGPDSPIVDFTKQESYARCVNAIDRDAESDDEFGDVRQEVMYAGPWFSTAQSAAASALAQRVLNWRRNVNKRIQVDVDPKDRQNAKVGELSRVSSNQIVQVDGTNRPTVMRITKVKEGGDKYAIEGITTRFAGRYCIISPNDWPDYLLATESQRFYGYICGGVNHIMTNGDECYKIA